MTSWQAGAWRWSRCVVHSAWVWLIWLAGCAGTETGNPSFDGTLSYNAYTTNAESVALLETDADAIVVDTAWLVLGDVGFVGSDGCDPSAQAPVHAHGLGAGDHAPAEAAVTALSMEPGRYCGMHLPFVRATTLAAGQPSELLDHPILIDGTLADGRAFSLLSAFEGDVFLEATAQDFEMDAMESDVLVGFDVAIWLGALDWASAVAGDNNVVRVDADNNATLLQAFESRIAAGTALYRDMDGGGQITVDSEKLADGTR